jgi:hypothetical protein
VVRATRLKLAALAGAVGVLHLVALEWIGREMDTISQLAAMAPVMFTRTLAPSEPPPVVATAPAAAPAPAARPRAAPRPKPPASSPEELRRQEQEDALAQEEARRRVEKVRREAELERKTAEAQAAAAAAAAAAASAAQAVSTPAEAASQARADVPSPDRWPPDTRLTYQLSGEFRGPLYGDAHVQWQRDATKYQVRLDVRIQLFGTQVITSQGDVTPEGLVPRVYEELRPGKRRFAQIGDQVIVLENGRTLPRPPGVQDAASQFVEFSQRFATGKEVLQVGRSVSVWLARPGGLDQWTYDVVDRVMLRTPSLGEVEAFHLKPRSIPTPRGNITAEMWIAPSLQYLPVRIKVVLGNEAWLDLLVDHIEQR